MSPPPRPAHDVMNMLNPAFKNCPVRPVRPPQRGFTLLEILIALLVLSVGLLGLAGLQVNGLHSNLESSYLTQAMAQAYDMSDRIRANRAGYYAGSYAAISATVPADKTCPSTCTAASGCAATAMAAYDACQWNVANSKLLPSGVGSITGNGNTLVIRVMWDAMRTGATGTACGGNPKIDLTCFQTSFQP